MHVSHPLIKDGTIESRLYQEVIVGNASKENTLVVAPTALGKTVIAVLLAAHRLEKFPKSRVLMISTTRPLVNQHASSFKRFLDIPEDEICIFTGYTPPQGRKELWKSSKVVCATPQVIENDLISARYSLRDVGLLVFDEAHRSTGDYPYTFIAGRYVREAENPLILGLTASPGGDEDKITEVCENLFIENIEVRTEKDPDVRPYIKGIEVEWVRVSLPPAFDRIKNNLEKALRERLHTLKNLGLLRSATPSISKKDLLTLREKLQKGLSEGGTPEVYAGLSNVAACINLSHALELLETQGLGTLQRYFERLQKGTSKAVKGLLRDVRVLRAMRLTEGLAEEMHHPKLDKLVDIVKKEPRGGRIMVFTQYRDSAQKIVESLNSIPERRAVRFVGQASKDRDKGLTQREQLAILEKFRAGEYNILVATSVAEEGLDIPKVDLVVFYEPIPSEIRSIQRRGRTGRSRAGRVVVLMAKNTRDEGFYWSSFHRERRMREILDRLKDKYYKPSSERQKQLMDFFEAEHSIVVDSRELASSVAKELLGHGIVSKPRVLEVGDYVLSNRLGVERKTAEDFLQSIVDKRLLKQIIRLKQSFERPVMIIEGEGLYSKRSIHPNAIRGALASIAVDFGIPILFTRDERDTAALLAAMVRREKAEGRDSVQIRGDKRVLTLREQQESVIAGLPGVNITLARRLLRDFNSVKRVFNASEEELTRVQGIGEKKAKEIRRVITALYGAEGGA
jgi:Fanconi anemia group M protein